MWIKLLWTFICKSLCGHIISVLLGKYLGVILLVIGGCMFNFIRNNQIAFQSDWTISHSQQEYMKVLMAPHPCQHWLFTVLILPILVGTPCYLIVVFFLMFLFFKKWRIVALQCCVFIVFLICSSLMTDDIGYLLKFVCVWLSFYMLISHSYGLPRWLSKESTCQCRGEFSPWVGKISWKRKWQPTPVFFFF